MVGTNGDELGHQVLRSLIRSPVRGVLMDSCRPVSCDGMRVVGTGGTVRCCCGASPREARGVARGAGTGGVTFLWATRGVGTGGTMRCCRGTSPREVRGVGTGPVAACSCTVMFLCGVAGSCRGNGHVGSFRWFPLVWLMTALAAGSHLLAELATISVTSLQACLGLMTFGLHLLVEL